MTPLGFEPAVKTCGDAQRKKYRGRVVQASVNFSEQRPVKLPSTRVFIGAHLANYLLVLAQNWAVMRWRLFECSKPVRCSQSQIQVNCAGIGHPRYPRREMCDPGMDTGAPVACPEGC